MSDDFDDDEFEGEELPEGLKGKKFGVIKATERVGRSLIRFLKDFEKIVGRLDDFEGEARKNFENVLVIGLENAVVTINRDVHALPFALSHRNQTFPDFYDDEAKQLCGLLSADLQTLKTITDSVGVTLKELSDHLEPIVRKEERKNRRKEGPVSAAKTGDGDEGPKSNILDFAERRGKAREKGKAPTFH